MNITWLESICQTAANTSIWLGIDDQSSWWHIVADSFKKELAEKISVDSDSVISLWPLMSDEQGGGDYETVRLMIVDRLSRIGLAPNLADSFPFLQIAQHALNRHPGWGELGLRWIASIPVNQIDHDLAYKLFVFSGNRKLNQSLRHKIKKQVHVWELNNGMSFVRPR